MTERQDTTIGTALAYETERGNAAVAHAVNLERLLEKLRAALRELEDANDAVCALRTADIYNAMLAVPGTQEALERLDAARRRARELSA